MKTLNRIWKLSLLLCGFGITTLAQQPAFKYRANLPKVDSAGYYRINLQPNLTAMARPDLSDLRIVASDGKFVAYVKPGDLPARGESRFTVFPQVKTKDRSDTSTVLIVQNPTDGPVNHLWIKLKNTAAERYVTLTGSDDLQQWFAISENITLSTAPINTSKPFYEQALSFPASSYRYLKLVINNHHKTPLNILEAGIYTILPAKPRYVPITPLTFRVADSPNHITHVYITFDRSYLINKLHIPVIPNSYFHRELNVYSIDNGHEWLTSKSFSQDDLDVNLSVRSKSMEIQIVNNDDQPLPINKIEASQSQNYIVAGLESGKPYYLVFGDNNARTPKYDLSFFVEKLNSQIAEISHQAVTANPAYKVAAIKPANNKPYLIWASIALAVAILSALTFTLTREVSKKGI